MSWLTNIFPWLKKKEEEPNDIIGQDIEPEPDDHVVITIDQSRLHFFRTMQNLIEHPRGYQVAQSHQNEFAALRRIFDANMREMQRVGHLEPFTLELSEEFAATWVHRTFQKVFEDVRLTSEADAEALNEMHREMTREHYHPVYRRNINNYRR